MSGCGFSHENGCKSSWAKFQYIPSQLNNTQKMIQLINKQTAMTATTDVASFPGHSHRQFLIACSMLCFRFLHILQVIKNGQWEWPGNEATTDGLLNLSSFIISLLPFHSQILQRTSSVCAHPSRYFSVSVSAKILLPAADVGGHMAI